MGTPHRPPVKTEVRSPPAALERCSTIQDAQSPFHENRARTADFEQHPAEAPQAPTSPEGQKEAVEGHDVQQQPAEAPQTQKATEGQKEPEDAMVEKPFAEAPQTQKAPEGRKEPEESNVEKPPARSSPRNPKSPRGPEGAS